MQDGSNGGAPQRRLAAGRYVLGARLGGGGSADVYEGVDTRLDRPVAVKLFRPGTDKVAERRFQEEALLLGPLHHPALVTIYDTGVEGGRAFQVLQLVEGVTLRELLLDGPLPVDQVREIGARLAEVLAYVHSRGIVHRDVKPSNVLVGQDPDAENPPVYLADFGISRLLDSAHLTATGLAIGTAAYMAPEQVRGHEVGPAADLYSLGLVLLEALTGKQEYRGATVEAAVARLSRPPLIPTRFHAPLPSLLAAMTRDDPVERPSAQECMAVLRGADTEIVLATEDPVPAAEGTTATQATVAAASPLGQAVLASTDDTPTPTSVVPLAAPASDPTSAGTAPQRRRNRQTAAGVAVLGLAAALVGGWLGLAGQDRDGTTPGTKPSTSPSAPSGQNPGAVPGGQQQGSPGAQNPAATPTTRPSASTSAEPSTEPTTEPTTPPSTSTEPPASPSADPDDEDNSGSDGGENGNSGPGKTPKPEKTPKPKDA